jgi:hypothetical protein
MIERTAEAAVNAANATSREAQFSRAAKESRVAHERSPEPNAPSAHHDGLAGLWDDAVGGVTDAYHATTAAIHIIGHAVDA